MTTVDSTKNKSECVEHERAYAASRQMAAIHFKEILGDSLIDWKKIQGEHVIIELESCLK